MGWVRDTMRGEGRCRKIRLLSRIFNQTPRDSPPMLARLPRHGEKKPLKALCMRCSFVFATYL